jgi:hypothetical protein
VLQADSTTQIDGFKNQRSLGLPAPSVIKQRTLNDDAGIDVSFEESCVCAIDATGKIVRASANIPAALGGHAVERRDVVARDALAVRVEHLAAEALALREGRTSFPSQACSPRCNTVSQTAGAGAGWRFDRLCVLWGYTINTLIIAPTSSLLFSTGGRLSTKGARSDGRIDQRPLHWWRFGVRYDNVFVPFPPSQSRIDANWCGASDRMDNSLRFYVQKLIATYQDDRWRGIAYVHDCIAPRFIITWL